MSTQPPRGRPRQGDRRPQAGRTVPKQQQRGPWLWIALGVIAVIVVGGGLLISRQSAASTAASATAAATGSAATGPIEGLLTFPNLARDHTDAHVNYPQTPPVGGPHNPVWLNCGIYDAPAPNENAVHSLEHGAVWITYQPELSAADVQQLRALVRGHSFVILSPYPGLPAPVVASAWGVQVHLTGASDPRLPQFIQKYEQGPQTPEPGATCSGGRGVPIAG